MFEAQIDGVRNIAKCASDSEGSSRNLYHCLNTNITLDDDPEETIAIANIAKSV